MVIFGGVVVEVGRGGQMSHIWAGRASPPHFTPLNLGPSTTAGAARLSIPGTSRCNSVARYIRRLCNERKVRKRPGM